MAKIKRNHNLKLIKERHSYTFTEISEVLKVHTRTVQQWHKQGLEVLDEASKPYLVYGGDLKQFLKDNQHKRKHPLKEDDFFCPKCRCARKSISENIMFEITSKRLGKSSKQVFIRGICEVCGQSLLLFSSDKKIEEMKKRGCFHWNERRHYMVTEIAPLRLT